MDAPIFKVVSELPETPLKNVIYLLQKGYEYTTYIPDDDGKLLRIDEIHLKSLEECIEDCKDLSTRAYLWELLELKYET